MHEDKKVIDLMVPVSQYPTIEETQSLKEAIVVLKKYLAKGKSYRSILVFGKNQSVGSKRIVGILTVRDIFNAIKKDTIPYDIDKLYPVSWRLFLNGGSLDESLNKKVRGALRPLVNATVDPNREVTTAIQKMMFSGVNIILVYQDEKVVGVLRAIDVLDYIGDVIL